MRKGDNNVVGGGGTHEHLVEGEMGFDKQSGSLAVIRLPQC